MRLESGVAFAAAPRRFVIIRLLIRGRRIIAISAAFAALGLVAVSMS